jgi:hypothetical protein
VGGDPSEPGQFVTVDSVSPSNWFEGLSSGDRRRRDLGDVHEEEQNVIVLHEDVSTVGSYDVVVVPSWVPRRARTRDSENVFNPLRQTLLAHGHLERDRLAAPSPSHNV